MLFCRGSQHGGLRMRCAMGTLTHTHTLLWYTHNTHPARQSRESLRVAEFGSTASMTIAYSFCLICSEASRTAPLTRFQGLFPGCSVLGCGCGSIALHRFWLVILSKPHLLMLQEY